MQIKTCLNCGRYFIPTFRQNEIYCDLKNVDGTPTCRDKFISIYFQSSNYTMYFRLVCLAWIRSNNCIESDYHNKNTEKDIEILLEIELKKDEPTVDDEIFDFRLCFVLPLVKIFL